MSIFDDVASGLQFNGIRRRSILDDAVERSRVSSALWDSGSDRLEAARSTLSGGEQQRLCTARALAVEPEKLLKDEPTSSLEPVSTRPTEDLMTTLKQIVTIVIVTHNMQQASRFSDDCALLPMGPNRAGEPMSSRQPRRYLLT